MPAVTRNLVFQGSNRWVRVRGGTQNLDFGSRLNQLYALQAKKIHISATLELMTAVCWASARITS